MADAQARPPRQRSDCWATSPLRSIQANFTLVDDYIDVATNAVVAVGGMMLVRRYI
jgi:hypothetical protein